jgi:hypothetical protein
VVVLVGGQPGALVGGRNRKIGIETTAVGPLSEPLLDGRPESLGSLCYASF